MASGSQTSLRALLDAIGRAAGRVVEPQVGPARLGDIRHSLADVSLARQALGFEARISLDEGMANAVATFGEAIGGREGSSSQAVANRGDPI